MAATKLSTSTQCNLIIKERTTKYVQVNIKADIKSRGILCKPELSNKFTQSYAITKDKMLQINNDFGGTRTHIYSLQGLLFFFKLRSSTQNATHH